MPGILKLPAVIVMLNILLVACNNTDDYPSGKTLICDAELRSKKGDKFISSTDSTAYFDGGKLQSTLNSYSGNYSVLTIPKKSAFALAYKINKAGSDWYFKVTVWRKSKDGRGVLVASAKNADILYEATSIPVEQDINGWEKLQLEVYTPPNFGKQELKFYVWNNGSDSVYFDDLVIERLESKSYPEYSIKPFEIFLDTSEYLKLADKRKHAFETTILESSDDDWVKGFIINNENALRARLRLKGDWLDHLQGDKWSFRVKMRKTLTWNRLRAFAVQTPSSRNFLLEWVSHQLYLNNDMLTTRYGFIPVYLNNESRGIYAWEEHFTKQLLEFNNRREGPILKFSEDAFWQVQKIFKQTNDWQNLPYYEAAVIKPFGESRTMRSPALRSQFINGQKLLNQYKNGSALPDQIFDLEKLAKYYALLELTQARHGMFWHNQRFYYNPVIDKLEPIAFDGYSYNAEINISMERNFLYQVYSFTEAKPEEWLFTNLFFDEKFVELYFEKLDEYTRAEFISTFYKSIAGEQHYYDSLLRMEFPTYHFDEDFIRKSANSIRSYLPGLQQYVKENKKIRKESIVIIEPDYVDTSIFQNTPEYYVNAYVEEVLEDSAKIRIDNYFPGNLTILGTGKNIRSLIFIDEKQSKIKPYKQGLDAEKLVLKTDTASRFLFFIVDDNFKTFVVPIYPWPSPIGLSARQELESVSELSNYSFIRQINSNELHFRNGEYTIENPVIIPAGFKVFIHQGTKIDIINKACIISYSPVFINGTIDKQIVITSSDFSANGFTVLQANETSVINNVLFQNLNTLDYKGWTLTGAVNFYESNVEIHNAAFYRNQCEDALNIIRSDFILSNSSFEYTIGDAFDSDFSTGIVDQCEFVNIGNDAIDFSGSRINISNVVMKDIGDKGVSGGEDSFLNVRNIKIERAAIGLASKDLSIVTVNNSEIRDCEYGLVLLTKKPEYGPAKMMLDETYLFNAKTKMLVEKGSQVIFNNDTINGEKINVGELFY